MYDGNIDRAIWSHQREMEKAKIAVDELMARERLKERLESFRIENIRKIIKKNKRKFAK